MLLHLSSVLIRYEKYSHDQLIDTLKSTSNPVNFSLLIDESNERGVEAKERVLIIFFYYSAMKTVTEFIDLLTAYVGTAAAFFQSWGLAYELLVGLNSYTCNTMKGKRNGCCTSS